MSNSGFHSWLNKAIVQASARGYSTEQVNELIGALKLHTEYGLGRMPFTVERYGEMRWERDSEGEA